MLSQFSKQLLKNHRPGFGGLDFVNWQLKFALLLLLTYMYENPCEFVVLAIINKIGLKSIEHSIKLSSIRKGFVGLQ